MLDVDGGVDVDAGVEQLLDVLVAAFVASAGRVGVRQFVDQRDLRLARQQPVQVELGELQSLVFLRAPRHDLEPFEQGLRLGAAVRFHQADDHVHALAAQLACRR